jgi:hypothetical protein
MKALHGLNVAGQCVNTAYVAFSSPYMTSGIRRFGDYTLDLKRPAKDWLRDRELTKAAMGARRAERQTEARPT